MSKSSIEFSSSDFIDIVEEKHDRIIIQDSEGSITLDRTTAERIYNKLDGILHDETFKQMEDKYLAALNEIDRLKSEVESLSITKIDNFSDYDHLDRVS